MGGPLGLLKMHLAPPWPPVSGEIQLPRRLLLCWITFTVYADRSYPRVPLMGLLTKINVLWLFAYYTSLDTLAVSSAEVSRLCVRSQPHHCKRNCGSS